MNSIKSYPLNITSLFWYEFDFFDRVKLRISQINNLKESIYRKESMASEKALVL